MGKYYVAGIPFDSENSLSHHGVKGMEWNKHKFGLDADTRFIKWINPNDINVGSYSKYGKMAEAAAKQKYGAAAPTPKGRLTTVYNKQSVMNSRDRAVQNMNRQKWNNSPIGKASNFVTGTANRAGKAIGTAAGNAGQWANQQAQNAGRAIGNAADQASKWAGQQAQNIDQNLNITGNKDRADAEKFRGYADKANSQFNKDYWSNRANESQNRANSSLAGRATAAGNWVGTQARNAGNAIGGAANAAGQWVGTQAQNVANSAPVQAVGNFIDQNITGNTDRAAAQGYQQIAEDLADNHHSQKWEDAAKRAQERADNTLFGRVGTAANAVGQAAQNVANSAPVQAVGEAARNVGGAISGAANSVGDWVGNAAQNVGNTVGQAAEQARGGIGGFFDRVGNAVGGAANAVGDWAGQAARDVGGAVSRAANQAGSWIGDQAQNVGEFVDNKLNLSGNQAQAEADRYRNLSNQASGQTSKDYWDAKASEAQQNADNSLSGRAKGFLNSAGQWVSGAANNVKSTASKAASDTKKGASGFLNSAGQWVSNAAGNVKNAANNAANAVGQAAQNVGNTVGQAAEQARGGIGGFFDRVGNAVGGAAQNVGNWAGNAAQDVGNAVSGAANAVGDWAGNAAQNVGGAVQNAGNWVGEQARNVGGNVGNWAGQAAQNVGNVVSGASGNVADWARNVPGNVGNFIDQNITGNSARAEANRYNNFAQNPNMDSVQQLMNQRAAENAQARADNTLFGRVGNAAGTVGDFARNLPGNIAGAAQGVGDWAGQAAKNVGGAVSGAAGWVGDRAREVADGPVGQWAGNAAQGIGQFINDIETARLQPKIQTATQQMTDNYSQYLQDHPENPQSPQHAEWLRDQIQNDPQLIAYYEQYMKHSAIDEKPDGVSDAFWEKFTEDGGTREDYERDWR